MTVLPVVLYSSRKLQNFCFLFQTQVVTLFSVISKCAKADKIQKKKSFTIYADKPKSENQYFVFKIHLTVY